MLHPHLDTLKHKRKVRYTNYLHCLDFVEKMFDKVSELRIVDGCSFAYGDHIVTKLPFCKSSLCKQKPMKRGQTKQDVSAI